VNADGTLTYSFIESVERSYPFYYVRLLGGALFLLGMFFMAYNTWKTAASGRAADADTAIPAAAH
jgi:cytochrome c oxidase cbb3-type subunit 1